MKTLLETLDGGTQWLEKKGIEDARRNMQLMMCHHLGCSKIHLYTRFDEPLTEEVLEPLRQMLQQRGAGVPLQHILGTVEFYRRDFKSDARALIPRQETEELVELVLAELKQRGTSQTLKVLDMGCGSGIIGITIAAELGDRVAVTCADISQDALQLAQENKSALGINNVTFCHSDLFSAIEQKFDFIVANLPYVPLPDKPTLAPELAHDPDLALFSGKDGLDIIRDFIPQSTQHLNTDSPYPNIALEIGIHQAPEVEKLLAEAGFSDIHTSTDIAGVARFPIATYAQ